MFFSTPPTPIGNRTKDFVPYTLPKLRNGKDCFIDFSAYDPYRETMRRKRFKLNHIPQQQRKAKAKEIIIRLTKDLRSGWNPWTDTPPPSPRKFQQCLKGYLALQHKLLKDGAIEPDTVRSRETHLSVFRRFAAGKIQYAHQIDRPLISAFLDDIYKEEQLTAHTQQLPYFHPRLLFMDEVIFVAVTDGFDVVSVFRLLSV